MKQTEILAAIVVFTIGLVMPAVILYPHFFNKSAHARSGEILLVARTFERGGFSPAEIRVKKGQRVRLRVLAQDATHSFQLLHLGIDTEPIYTGTTKVVEFVANRPGSFPFYCNVRCSARHENLMGLLIVEN